MNVHADGTVETKIYLQSADAVALAEGLGPRSSRLAADARAERADAGGVLSFDVTDGNTSPRAFFIALREPPRDLWRCVLALPGFDADEIEAGMPFAPAPPRSVGVALDRDEWTLYCKPRDSFGAPQSLEPTTVFRDGDLEVGVFVEPNEAAPRAFRRTERSAVSIRVRQGSPVPHHLESLVDWFTDRLSAAEAAGTRPCLTDPPAPWHAVDVDGVVVTQQAIASRRRVDPHAADRIATSTTACSRTIPRVRVEAAQRGRSGTASTWPARRRRSTGRSAPSRGALAAT